MTVGRSISGIAKLLAVDGKLSRRPLRRHN
jgi:hypothetical protein